MECVLWLQLGTFLIVSLRCIKDNAIKKSNWYEFMFDILQARLLYGDMHIFGLQTLSISKLLKSMLSNTYATGHHHKLKFDVEVTRHQALHGQTWSYEILNGWQLICIKQPSSGREGHYLHTIKTKNEIIIPVIPHAMVNWVETFRHKEMNHSLTFVFIVSFGILLCHFIFVGVS